MKLSTRTGCETLALVNLWQAVKALLEVGVCRNVVTHFAVIILLISNHIKVACTCKTEENCLFFACFLTLESLVNCNSDCVTAFGSRKNTPSLPSGFLLTT